MLGLIFLFPIQFPLHAQTTKTTRTISFEFIEQNIRDILYSLSTYTSVPIIADDTVTGSASFQYSGASFEKAFESFLLVNRLYAEKSAELWIVSKIRIALDNEDRITLDALDASPAQILGKLSQRMNATIIQDILPATRLSLHMEDVSLLDAVELVMKPFPDYTVENSAHYIQIKKTLPAASVNNSTTAGGKVEIRENAGIFEASFEKVKLSQVLETLFPLGNKEYSSFVRGDQVIERLRFSGKTFPEALALILDQVNAEHAEISGIWYILPIQQTEVLRRLRDEGKSWKRFTLRYLAFKDLQPIIQARFPLLATIPLPDGMSFLSFLTDASTADIQNQIGNLDQQSNSTPIHLKYIKTETLLKTLPPSVSRDLLVDAGDGSTLFFTGTHEKLQLFLKDLAEIDKPHKRIRYDLLIIQHQDTSDLKWGFSVDARQVQVGDRSMVTGTLGSLLSLNFDAVSVFGYQFAAKMSAELAENQASIFADTTLYGLSGQEIKFQNTNTYRYKDSNIDPDTGEPIYSGVTREIISGLILNISGWVSGDGMITTTVTATVSKRGADVSATVGNPPPTSEKVLTTQVRSRSGETVVLSGLRQNDSTIVEQRVPYISRIPILGWLFRGTTISKENSQMVIYLVPHVDLGDDLVTSEGGKLADLYTRLVKPYVE